MASAAGRKNLREGRIMRLARWLGRRHGCAQSGPIRIRHAATPSSVSFRQWAVLRIRHAFAHLSLPADHRPEGLSGSRAWRMLSAHSDIFASSAGDRVTASSGGPPIAPGRDQHSPAQSRTGAHLRKLQAFSTGFGLPLSHGMDGEYECEAHGRSGLKDANATASCAARRVAP